MFRVAIAGFVNLTHLHKVFLISIASYPCQNTYAGLCQFTGGYKDEIENSVFGIKFCFFFADLWII